MKFDEKYFSIFVFYLFNYIYYFDTINGKPRQKPKIKFEIA